jgi:hypothetical protein
MYRYGTRSPDSLHMGLSVMETDEVRKCRTGSLVDDVSMMNLARAALNPFVRE